MGWPATIAKAPFKLAALPFKGAAGAAKFGWKSLPPTGKALAVMPLAFGMGAGLMAYDTLSPRIDPDSEPMPKAVPEVRLPSELIPEAAQARKEMDFPEQPHARRVLANRGQELPLQPAKPLIAPDSIQDAISQPADKTLVV